jgi:hypothetical protein
MTRPASLRGQPPPDGLLSFRADGPGRIAHGRALRVGVLPSGKHEYGFHPLRGRTLRIRACARASPIRPSSSL